MSVPESIHESETYVGTYYTYVHFGQQRQIKDAYLVLDLSLDMGVIFLKI